MKKFFALIFILIIVVVSGCIFSMNDDYDKGVGNDGGEGGNGEYTVSGVIIDISGNGISGIVVELIGESTLSTMTNDSGNYTFENVAEGSYVVTPEKDGYMPMPVDVEGESVFVGTVKPGGHGGNKNSNYSCTLCH